MTPQGPDRLRTVFVAENCDGHMTPIARNGTDHWWKLQRTWQRCNHRKGTMTHEEFLASGRLRRASGSSWQSAEGQATVTP
jgi:5-methylcytosine-specific restriction endonuclease McrA